MRAFRRSLSFVAGAVATVTILGGGLAAVAGEIPESEPPIAPVPNPFTQQQDPRSLDDDGDGRLTVEVYVDSPALLDDVRAGAPYLEVATSSQEFGVLAGSLPVERWDELNELPGVRSVTVPPPPVVGGHGLRAAAPLSTATIPAPSCRSVPVEADAPLTAAEAREVFGVDGSGVTVGIISDSFAAAWDAVTTRDEDVRLGSLPGPGNPCGYTTAVTVVRDASPDEGGLSDEGRAMAQLVHGIAPGAPLLFANAGQSKYEMAEAIDLLVAAGADIIVDDISFYDSPMYQQGPIDSAIARARAQGVSHYSSAGNSSRSDADTGAQIGSWISSDFVPTVCPPALVGLLDNDGCMNFGTAVDPDPTNRITYTSDNGALDLSVMLQWAEPWYGVDTPLAVVALSTGPDPQPVGFGLCANTSVLPLYTCDQSHAHLSLRQQGVPAAVELDLVVVRVLNAGVTPGTLPSPGIRLQLLRARGGVSLEHQDSFTDASHTVVVGPTLAVNNAGPNVFSVGAAAFDDASELREYSAFGPYGHLFEPVSSAAPGTPADPLATPWTRPGPDAVSIDGTRTSFFGHEDPAGVFRFEGTSAAAPHAAAIAALVRAAHTDAPLTVDQEFDALRTATTPVSTTALGPGVSPVNATGGGLIDAAGALVLSGAPTDAYWAAPVPPDEIPATSADLEAEACASCTPQFSTSLAEGRLTVRGDASTGVTPGDWVWLFAYSSPVNLGWVRFDNDLGFTVDVSGLPAGDHSLALFHGTRQLLPEQPILAGLANFTIPGSDSGGDVQPAGVKELANSGVDGSSWPWLGGLAGVLVALGAMLAALGSRSRREA